jgi:hypothetical protein
LAGRATNARYASRPLSIPPCCISLQRNCSAAGDPHEAPTARSRNPSHAFPNARRRRAIRAPAISRAAYGAQAGATLAFGGQEVRSCSVRSCSRSNASERERDACRRARGPLIRPLRAIRRPRPLTRRAGRPDPPLVAVYARGVPQALI